MTVFPSTCGQSQGQALLRRILYGINDDEALQVEVLGSKNLLLLEGKYIVGMPQAQMSRDTMRCSTLSFPQNYLLQYYPFHLHVLA